MIAIFSQLCLMYLILILCTAPQNNGAIPIPRRMREQHESDSEDEEDVIEDVARQYFIYSIHVASLI